MIAKYRISTPVRWLTATHSPQNIRFICAGARAGAQTHARKIIPLHSCNCRFSNRDGWDQRGKTYAALTWYYYIYYGNTICLDISTVLPCFWHLPWSCCVFSDIYDSITMFFRHLPLCCHVLDIYLSVMFKQKPWYYQFFLTFNMVLLYLLWHYSFVWIFHCITMFFFLHLPIVHCTSVFSYFTMVLQCFCTWCHGNTMVFFGITSE